MIIFVLAFLYFVFGYVTLERFKYNFCFQKFRLGYSDLVFGCSDTRFKYSHRKVVPCSFGCWGCILHVWRDSGNKQSEHTKIIPAKVGRNLSIPGTQLIGIELYSYQHFAYPSFTIFYLFLFIVSSHHSQNAHYTKTLTNF